MQLPGAVLTFIVRVTAHDAGQLAGTVERVRTGERHRFQSAEELGAIVTRIAAGEPPTDGAGAGRGASATGPRPAIPPGASEE